MKLLSNVFLDFIMMWVSVHNVREGFTDALCRKMNRRSNDKRMSAASLTKKVPPDSRKPETVGLLRREKLINVHFNRILESSEANAGDF